MNYPQNCPTLLEKRLSAQWKRILVMLMAILWFSGCASTKTHPAAQASHTANIHKVLVVCVQGVQEMNRRIESSMLPRLRHQGFDAVTPQDLFPAASRYVPEGLMELIQQAQVDGIMQITYSGVIPVEGMPRQYRFKYYSMKSRPVNLSDHPNTLDAALAELVAGPAH